MFSQRRPEVLQRSLRKRCGPGHHGDQLRLRPSRLRDLVTSKKASRIARPFRFILGNRYVVVAPPLPKINLTTINSKMAPRIDMTHPTT